MHYPKFLSRQYRLDWKELAVCGLLFFAVAAVFGQTVYHDFVNYDDKQYVYENPQVLRGWTASGVTWAFTQSEGAAWIPLTWLSLMTDTQLFGAPASGYHLTNVLLHAAMAILLFLVLRRMTGVFWPSALVAAIFALHPLRVESVAWVTERKDVLSGVFFMLTLWAYWSYTRHQFSWVRYGAVLVLLTLGLMAKPILVTVPFVLLILDYWPLGRLSPVRQRVLEKIPMLIPVVAVCAITLAVQGETMISVERAPLWWRLNHAVIAYVGYVGQFFWPAGLAVLYPRPALILPIWKIAASFLILATITVAAWKARRTCPYLLAGWLWYLVMMTPVIGLVQFGAQATADRFTYLPHIGLTLALTWGAIDLCRALSARRRAWVSATAVAVLVVAAGWSWHQTTFWRTSKTLWNRAIACTEGNYVAHNNLGLVWADLGNFDKAIEHYQIALKIHPKSDYAHNNLGNALAAQNRMDEAVKHFQKAVEITPRYPSAYNNLGNVFAMQGKTDKAAVCYRKAIEINPRYIVAYNNLTKALLESGQTDEAMACTRKALDVYPDDAVAHNNLGHLMVRKGQMDAAIEHFAKAVQLDPYYASARNNLGSALAHQGRIGPAVVQYQAAVRLDPKNPSTRNNFAKALAMCGWLGAAADQYRKVLKLDPDNMESLQSLAWLRAACPKPAIRNGDEAVRLAEKAEKLSGGKRPDVLDTLAAAYAEAGKYAEARDTARNAMTLAAEQKNSKLADALRDRISLYEAGKPYRQTLSQNPAKNR